jgi:hypothetical protein
MIPILTLIVAIWHKVGGLARGWIPLANADFARTLLRRAHLLASASGWNARIGRAAEAGLACATAKGTRMTRLMITACFGMLLTGQVHGQTAPRAEEMPLVISASGSTHTPADKITLTIPLRGSGDSDAAAKAQIADKLQRLRTALIAQDVQPGAIAASAPFGQMGYIGNETFDPDDMPPATGPRLPAGMATANRHAMTSVVRVSLTSGAALTRVQQVVADLQLATYLSPIAWRVGPQSSTQSGKRGPMPIFMQARSVTASFGSRR